jgi:2-polyprenyl-3-methyl-5-hydroxy-6-metoxy-1,4-benzoquinol methylase
MHSYVRVRRILHIMQMGRLDYLRYALWTRWKRLDFQKVPLEELGLSEEHAHQHTASGGAFLVEALNEVDIPSGSRVIDFGCGKGSAMCTLAKFPFAEVAGVELSEPMAAIARANGRKLALKKFRVYVSDAGKFEDLDRFTHLYMFNLSIGVQSRPIISTR